MTATNEVDALGGESAHVIAERYGLRQLGVRPPLGEYIRSLWNRREFIGVLARSKVYAENQHTYLGQIWALLNPVMNAAVYVLIFGFILTTDRGVENIIGFIVVGTFMYRFFSESVTDAARSIPKNLNLVRSLHFPRAVLPLSVVGAQLVGMFPAIFVMAMFTLVSDRLIVHTDVTPSWRWFLIIPAALLIYLFSTGVGFILARICAGVPDLLNLMPFILRLGMYASGVLFSIDHYIHNAVLANIASYQPVAIYLDLARQAMLVEPAYPLDLFKWSWGFAWAVALFVIGFIVFWRDEARYGRE